MIKYKYTIDNQSIETLNKEDIPNGIEFEAIEFEIPSEVVEVPFEVPLWTMRNVMRKANIFDLIIGAINQLPEPLKTDALDYLEYGNYIERHSNTVLLIQQITQFTDAQVDQLFIDADKLEL